MTSFQAKLCWKRQGKGESKNFGFFLFLPNALQKNPKKQPKNSKNSKVPLWLHFKLKQVGREQEREKIKIIIPFRSCPTRNRKLQKKQQKNSKNLKVPL